MKGFRKLRAAGCERIRAKRLTMFVCSLGEPEERFRIWLMFPPIIVFTLDTASPVAVMLLSISFARSLFIYSLNLGCSGFVWAVPAGCGEAANVCKLLTCKGLGSVRFVPEYVTERVYHMRPLDVKCPVLGTPSGSLSIYLIYNIIYI